MTMPKRTKKAAQSSPNLSALYSPTQQRIMRHALTHDFFMLINHGAKRSGKTIMDNDLFLYELRRVRKEADARGVSLPQYILAGADLATLRRNVLTELSNRYGLEFNFDKANRFKLFGVLVCCFGHSKISDLGRIRGMTAWGAYINEATVANELVFDEIRSRCSAPGARIIMDTNPDRPGHWLKKDYIDKADGKVITQFHWTLTDNTFLTQRYIDNLKASTPSGVFYERDINGAWVAAEGVVYPDFDRNIHYIQQSAVPSIVRYYAGMDFGWQHPGAIVLLGDDADGNTYLLREWASQHRSIDDWIHIILHVIQPTTGPLTVYCDSARPDLIDEMQNAGIDARNAHKDVIGGISTIATMFKTRHLYIVRDAVTRFDEEIDTYIWADGQDAPVKQNDDVMDALRYGIYSEKIERAEAMTANTDNILRGGLF